MDGTLNTLAVTVEALALVCTVITGFALFHLATAEKRFGAALTKSLVAQQSKADAIARARFLLLEQFLMRATVKVDPEFRDDLYAAMHVWRLGLCDDGEVDNALMALTALGPRVEYLLPVMASLKETGAWSRENNAKFEQFWRNATLRQAERSIGPPPRQE